MKTASRCASCTAQLDDREDIVSDGRRYAHRRCALNAGGHVHENGGTCCLNVQHEPPQPTAATPGNYEVGFP